MTVSRRTFLKTSAAMTAAAGLVGAPALAFAESVDIDELLTPGPLGDKVLGSEDAPVTIVEYASMTCGHCANFHKRTYPELKKQYIETGKVKFIFREFPLDPVAAAAFMLARSAPADKYFDIIDTMFENQSTWAFSDNPYSSLLNFSKQIGFTQESFEEALKNQKLLDAINAVRERGSNEFKVGSTPTFFVNGEKHAGALPFDQMSELIDAEL
ncbi:dsba oxidoreductase [Roseibium sp. TrichSKD4]|uniref:thioredoxin domain-containing protein n=1 Tax=Roseibium sp. TrichSKD4 TaxID=744980 RepID=UPI0001E56192|nr:thioredoxin domain-containing protein [Roseibium sp. TrichSKD4]EFO34429.1 dsba oxidoreductase [Roseibium sp. TrichSKD4]